MTDVLAFSVFGVEWQFIKPFIVIGLAFGGVYALSGVGLVVLYRATGVLNLAFGAIGAAGALIAYWLINHTSCPQWLAFTVCVAFGGVVNLLYGTRYSDLCYGYNAFWVRCLSQLEVDCDGFEVETLINVRAAKAGLCIVEVPRPNSVP